jgi:hypothetical protein
MKVRIRPTSTMVRKTRSTRKRTKMKKRIMTRRKTCSMRRTKNLTILSMSRAH